MAFQNEKLRGAFTVTIVWENAVSTWSVGRHRGTGEEIAAFIREWSPKCPDPELLEEALARLSTEIPEGIF